PVITGYVSGTGQTGDYTISGSPVLVSSATNMQTVGDYYNPPYAYGGDVVIPTPATTSACTWTTTNPHNLVVGNAVVLTAAGGSAKLPTGFSGFTPYYVTATNFSTTTFCLAAAPGGSNITPTSNGSATTTTFSQDTADLYLLLLGYKYSPLFKQMVLDQISQFQAGVLAGGAPANGSIWGWFADIGTVASGANFPSPWTLCQFDDY